MTFEPLSEAWKLLSDKGQTVDVGGKRLVYKRALGKLSKKEQFIHLTPRILIDPDKISFDMQWAEVPEAHREEVLRLLGTVDNLGSLYSVVRGELPIPNPRGLEMEYTHQLQSAFVRLTTSLVYDKEALRRFVDAVLWFGDSFPRHFDGESLQFDIDADALVQERAELGLPVSRIEVELTVGSQQGVPQSEFAVALAYGVAPSDINAESREARSRKPMSDRTPLSAQYRAVDMVKKDSSATVWAHIESCLRRDMTDDAWDLSLMAFMLDKLSAIVPISEMYPYFETSGGRAVLASGHSLDRVLAAMKEGIDLDLLDVVYAGGTA